MKKLCILAAGIGSRNDNISGLHKALLPLENRPVISHILDKLNDDIEIVIALGYKSEQIKSYMELVHSDRNITYIDVDNYDGVGAGPGYSLLCCKEKLKEPFVFTSVDTLVESDFDFMSIDENWLGVSSVDVNESINYCLVEGSKYLDKLYYGSGDTAYIGMAGVHDYNDFWNSLEKHKIIKARRYIIHQKISYHFLCLNLVFIFLCPPILFAFSLSSGGCNCISISPIAYKASGSLTPLNL